MRNPGRRKISAGTIVMLAALVIVLALTVFLLARLSSGGQADLRRLRRDTADPEETGSTQESRTAEPAAEKPAPVPTAAPVPAESGRTEPEEQVITLTFAGTVALDGEVRTNSYYSEAKQYDFYDTMALLRRELQSDLNICFLENILTGEGKTSDTVSTPAGAAMLKNAGFNAAACGFSKAYDKTETGIASTRKILSEQGIVPLGVYENSAEEHFRILDVKGVRVALLQYTDTVPASARRNMEKKGTSGMVPAADPEMIAADISAARARGCDAVIVLLNWGKNGKAPDKNMRSLAQKITDAGADLIVGSGSRIVSGAELLTSAGNGKQVLCVWSLGTVLSGSRELRKMAGMLLQVTVRKADGQTRIGDFRYIPLYTWKYRQDSRYYYRCLASNGSVPDGMDSEQQKNMKKAAETVRKAMKDSPAEERISE